MNKLDEIFNESHNSAEFAEKYIIYLSEVLKKINIQEIVTFIEILQEARDQGKHIFFIGNGGSAATASHFANDLAIGTRSWKKPLKVISLCDNNAIVSAIGNDDGFENIFLQQLQVLMEPEDIVVAISASGNSPNVIKAIRYANENGAKTVGLTAFNGGELRKISVNNIHIPTGNKEYGPAEDGHMILDHLIGSYLSRFIQQESQTSQ
ncbi:MAG: SIS domain-containing protein [Desulfamplus sp.]|nr:SIS domain-containing protein [Desulfamplus sp.]